MEPGFLDRTDAANQRRWAELRPASAAWDDASGDCILASVAGRLEVLQADPRVRIAEEVLACIRAGEGRPEVTLRGDLLRIDAANRRVVYRLVRYVPRWRAWEAQWPD